MLEDPEQGAKLLNELYLAAVRNNYFAFRLGEERIIVAPATVQVEREKDVVRTEKEQSKSFEAIYKNQATIPDNSY
jgi:hypothetical protein